MDVGYVDIVQKFTGFMPLSVNIDIRKYVFVQTAMTCNSVLNHVHFMFGQVEVEKLAKENNVAIGCTHNIFKNCLHQRLL